MEKTCTVGRLGGAARTPDPRRRGVALKRALANRIRASEIVLAFAGKYSTYSHWIEFEVETAFALGRPIVAVRPRGQKQLSSVVMDRCAMEVGWNGSSVREAILECLPGARWLIMEPVLRRWERIEERREALGLARPGRSD